MKEIKCSLEHAQDCQRVMKLDAHSGHMDVVIQCGSIAVSITISGQELINTLVAMGYKPS